MLGMVVRRSRCVLGCAVLLSAAAIALWRSRPWCSRKGFYRVGVDLACTLASAFKKSGTVFPAQVSQLALPEAPQQSVLRVRFIPRVECMLVPDLADLPMERKATFWWQLSDFDEFLRVRVEISQAYQEVAKKLGLKLVQLQSVGSHGDEGYMAMIQHMPELMHESRRGLGLGRRVQRLKNRDAYIAAVVNDQQRQREAFIETRGTSIPFRLDDEALARVARSVSEEDLQHAICLAQMYYKQDQQRDRSGTDMAGLPTCLSQSNENLQFAPVGMIRFGVDAPDDQPPRRDGTVSLTGECVEEVLGGSDQQVSPLDANSSQSSKGFGLTLQKLQGAGLSATGNAIRRIRRQGCKMLQDDDSSAESVDGESEDYSDSCISRDDRDRSSRS